MALSVLTFEMRLLNASISQLFSAVVLVDGVCVQAAVGVGDISSAADEA